MAPDDSIRLHPELAGWLRANLDSSVIEAAATNPLMLVNLAVRKRHADTTEAALDAPALAAWRDALHAALRDLQEGYIAYAAEAARHGVAPEIIARTVQAPAGTSLDQWVAELESELERTHPANSQEGFD